MAKKKTAEPRVIEAENRMYELMLVLKPDLLESAVTKKLKEFTKFLKENECKVTMEDVWGKQNLAYRIKQYDAGIYVVYNLEAPTTFIKEIDNHLRIDNEVIRHLLVSIENDYKYSKFDEEVEKPKEEKKEKKPAKVDKPIIKEEKVEEKEEKKGEVVEEPKEKVVEKKEEKEEKKEEVAEEKKEKEEVAEEPKDKVVEKEEKKEEEKAVEEKKEDEESKEEEKKKEEKEEKKKEEKEEIDRSALDSKLDDLLSGDDLNI